MVMAPHNRKRSNIMGNDKSKRTGTLHLKTTAEPDKLAATTASTMDSTATVLEPATTPPDTDAALNSDGAHTAPGDGMAAVEHVSEAKDTAATNVPTSSTAACTS
jgi:hypothetical protein